MKVKSVAVHVLKGTFQKGVNFLEVFEERGNHFGLKLNDRGYKAKTG